MFVTGSGWDSPALAHIGQEADVTDSVGPGAVTVSSSDATGAFMSDVTRPDVQLEREVNQGLAGKINCNIWLWRTNVVRADLQLQL